MNRFLHGLIIFLISFQVYGRAIEVTVRDYGWLTSFPLLRDVLDFYVQDVENDVNDEQPIIDPSRVNYAAANSSVLASKGLGTDYVNDPEKFILTAGAGAAWDDEKNVAIRDEISGAAAASSLSLGVRMDHLLVGKIFGKDSRRFFGFINFGSLTGSQVLEGSEIDIAGNIHATNFGLHLRYDLIEKNGSETSGWGGVKLHFGYEYNRNTVDLKTTLDEQLEVSTTAGVLSGRLTGNPTFRVQTNTHSIPLEITSSIYFLRFLNLFGGIGSDLNFGSSKGSGDIDGDIATLACTSGACVGETVLPQLEAKANYDARSTVRNFTLRVMAGAQINLPLGLSAFGQAQQIIGTRVIGAQAGLKYSF